MGTSTRAVLPSNRRRVCLPLPKAKSFCLSKTGAIEIYLLDAESESICWTLCSAKDMRETAGSKRLGMVIKA